MGGLIDAKRERSKSIGYSASYVTQTLTAIMTLNLDLQDKILK